MNDINIKMIEKVARGLDVLNEHIAFVGGAIAGIYADDPAAEDARPTTDVDCVIQLGTINEQYTLENELCKRNFIHDIESGIICRWKFQGITVDIMPDDEKILGFSNRWYSKGMINRIKHILNSGDTIYIFPANYYLATKIEAVASRGGNDLRCSHDFEDIIFVLNGRTNIAEELKSTTDKELRTYLQDKFNELLRNSNIEECINCALPYGEEERCEYILSLLKIMEE